MFGLNDLNPQKFVMMMMMMMMVTMMMVMTCCACVCSIREVSLDIAEDRRTGQPRAFEVEHCQCPPGYRGLSCEVTVTTVNTCR